MLYSNAFSKNSSKILLGTAYFGETISSADAFKIMDEYVALGGNHIDTARLYADGEAEKIIAAWFKSRKPQNVFVSTKGGYPLYETPNVSRLSENELRHDLELSLKALQSECVNFYWLHRDDEKIPVSEIIEALNKFKKEGKILHFGASNWRYERIKEANLYAKLHNLSPFEASQIRFSPAVLVKSGDGRDLVNMDKKEFALYEKDNLPVAAYASQAKGFFSKMVTLGEKGLSVKAKQRYLSEENLRTLEAIKTVSKKYGSSIASAVCASLSSIKSVNVFPIIGGSRVEQITDSIKGADICLKDSEIKGIFRF